LARFAGTVWQLEDHLQSICKLVEGWSFRVDFQGTQNGTGRHRKLGGRNYNPRPPGLFRRKRGLEFNCLGRSRGGFSTKIHAIVDAKGRPLHLELTPGQKHEASVAEALLEHAQGAAFIADTGYDSERNRLTGYKTTQKATP